MSHFVSDLTSLYFHFFTFTLRLKEKRDDIPGVVLNSIVFEVLMFFELEWVGISVFEKSIMLLLRQVGDISSKLSADPHDILNNG